MLSLSITTVHAIKALRCLDDPTCPTRHISDIARCSGVPKPYLAKIIPSLSQHGLVSTKRGYRGGIALARPATAISLLEIVVAVEGEHWMSDCLLGLGNCGIPDACPTRSFWGRIRKEIEQELQKLKLADLIRAQHAPTFSI